MTDFLGDTSNGVISGMRVPRIKSANLSPVTVPYISSTPTNPSFDIAANYYSVMDRCNPLTEYPNLCIGLFTSLPNQVMW